VAFGWILALSLSACGTMPQTPGRVHRDPPPQKVLIPPEPAPSPAPARPGPRAVAGLQLTEQGVALLKRGKLDEAITVLERAVGLNPAQGKNYYYLSEAWYSKGNFSQAYEFHRLAEMYLRGESGWAGRVAAQKEKIHRKK
jgi:tetratricopeptide (TPR) repeat protein